MNELKLLLIDDEEKFVSTLAERLELRGFKVKVANDGEDGLKIVESDLPDLIVLDLKMPGLSGIEVLKRIKSSHPDLPVILLTGYGSTEEGIMGKQAGVLDYMTKPLNINELLSKIDEAFDGRNHE